MRTIAILALLALGIIALTGCGGSTDGGAAGPADPAAMVLQTEQMGFIPSSKAGQHVGEEATVRGLVKDYQWISGRPKRPHLLLFDTGALIERGSSISEQEIPDTFTVVIWKEDALANFPSSTNFGPVYLDKVVCVTGTIEIDFGDRPSIRATHADQLKADC